MRACASGEPSWNEPNQRSSAPLYRCSDDAASARPCRCEDMDEPMHGVEVQLTPNRNQHKEGDEPDRMLRPPKPCDVPIGEQPMRHHLPSCKDRDTTQQRPRYVLARLAAEGKPISRAWHRALYLNRASYGMVGQETDIQNLRVDRASTPLAKCGFLRGSHPCASPCELADLAGDRTTQQSGHLIAGPLDCRSELGHDNRRDRESC